MRSKKSNKISPFVFISAVVAVSFVLVAFVYVVTNLNSVMTANRISNSSAASENIYVSPSGKDTNSGAESAPLQTISAGVLRAGAGSTIKIAAGVYNEQVVIKKSGVAGKPIVIEGSGDSTIINAGESVTGWTSAFDVAKGVYKKSWSSSAVNPLTWNDTYLIGLNSERANSSSWTSEFREPDWNAYKGVYAVRNNTIYVRLEGDVDPNSQRMTAAKPMSAGFLLDNADYITIRNLQIKNAYSGVLLTNGAGFNIIENTFIPVANDSITVFTNAHDNIIRNNRLTLQYGKPLSHTYTYSEDVWNAFRVLSTGTRQAIAMYFAGDNNEIANNTIYDHFQGIIDRGIGGSHPKTAANRELAQKYNRNLKVYNNTISRCANSGLGIGGSAINHRWYENVVDSCLHGLRFHDHTAGPVYVYRNILSNPQTHAIYYDTASVAPTYIYHNTIDNAESGVQFGYASTSFANNAPNTWYLNNVFNSKTIGTIGRGTWSNRPIFAYNSVPSGTSSTWLSDGNNIVQSTPVRWESGYRPVVGSVILGKALDLRTQVTIRSKRTPTSLPGLNNYYGNSFDMGAVQRTATTPSTPVPAPNRTPIITSVPVPTRSAVPIPSATPMNTPTPVQSGIKASVWNNLLTSVPATMQNLLQDSRYSGSPSQTTRLSSLDIQRQSGDNYGVKVKGYLVPPVSGNYVFYVSGDDIAHFWLSTDQQEANEKLLAYTNDWTLPQEWNKYASQTSVEISLTANKPYYFEFYVVESKFDDHGSVWWKLPSKTTPEKITTNYITSEIPKVSPSLLTVRAKGTAAFNEYAAFSVKNGSSFINSLPITTTATYTDYPFTIPGTSRIEDFEFHFVNDARDENTGQDRSLFIESVTLHGVTYNSSDSDTYSSGVWRSGMGCTSGYFQSLVLHCNGWFSFK